MPLGSKRVKQALLPDWEISLAFASPKVARSLNKKLRGKSYTPNVLAYQVGTQHGEVIICREVARREAASYGHSSADHLLFLFIHALLHLAGMAHGSTMEKREQSLLSLYGSKNRNRHRRGHAPSQGRRPRRVPR